jgi:EmrB/QacA subfamily drug resistance transporter
VADSAVQQSGKAHAAGTGAGIILITLALAQFLMVLDTSVMNVSIATVAADVGTTVTGIQSAITLFTLTMATLMLTGGKIGSIIGRRRVFAIGLIIYAIGSGTTALAPNLNVLYLGWSLLEGIGSALILPAIVALVAGNVSVAGRPRAYGMIAAAAAIAVAVGPLIGGFATTYFSWRWVFAGEVVVAAFILLMSRRFNDPPVESKGRLDIVGTVLTILGLGAIVYALLKSGEWGWVSPNPGSPQIAGISMTTWLLIAGMLITWLFIRWEARVERSGGDPLLRAGTLRKHPALAGGVSMFFFQYLLQGGYFFIVPLFLSVVLGLNALETGVRLVPLSLAVIVTALGIPRVLPNVSPRLVVRVGVFLMLAGLLVLLAGVDLDADAAVVAVPMILVGLGIGCLASQLGSVTVSAVPAEESGEVGGLQNTFSNLGISVGTAVAGSIMIAVLTTSMVEGIAQNPDIPEPAKSQATTQLAEGVPFISDADLEAALAANGVDPALSEEVVAENREARIAGLDAAITLLILAALVSLFFTGSIPSTQAASPGGGERERSESG